MQQLVGLLPIVLMLGLFYIMVFIPEKKRRKKYDEMLTNLKLNDEIMTKGGIMGKIINIQDDHIILESGPDRARIKIAKQGISHIVKASEVALTKED
ncbi:preprotein translocase, YajC subunit [Clostridium argentinense CDC 2741]|uniref:Preprotein translocase, YajC subunit n=1 Tax=Clostridium argentinense CDC 2741 TaxID=1418104 RepID=A0A0C1U496_9CLOT|nr:preprotein translocase subunit YajC [Clostridium argentinense]HAG43788.1 preprotein translocase subunit YajC [Clostridium sp.]ARC84581.1 preprotein translocase subunit YajC [Clostridium argentinense]KIE47614.1 preprotein translocase, YajC subunit [Clostridium argentinense CDC 2741]NFF38636.1 preprotein translocase subunit YajC [Clostridium argentinense]NFP48861.1 preprotein translocase subunit YajC [Clostridium argentinense]